MYSVELIFTKVKDDGNAYHYSVVAKGDVKGNIKMLIAICKSQYNLPYYIGRLTGWLYGILPEDADTDTLYDVLRKLCVTLVTELKEEYCISIDLPLVDIRYVATVICNQIKHTEDLSLWRINVQGYTRKGLNELVVPHNKKGTIELTVGYIAGWLQSVITANVTTKKLYDVAYKIVYKMQKPMYEQVNIQIEEQND